MAAGLFANRCAVMTAEHEFNTVPNTINIPLFLCRQAKAITADVATPVGNTNIIATSTNGEFQ